jgi:hypothetical protein
VAGKRKKKLAIVIPEIAVMEVADLKPAAYNPREITEDALAGLQAAMERYGLVDLIVYNKRTGFVVGGHQRLKVLQAAGVEKCPVVIVDLKPADEKGLNATLNNPEIQGRFTGDVTVLLGQVSRGIGKAAFGGMRLDALLASVSPKQLTPPPDFPSFDRNVTVDYECPKCQYTWSGKPS